MTCEDPATGRELWVTDGTEATTRLVKDLEPGPLRLLPSKSRGRRWHAVLHALRFRKPWGRDAAVEERRRARRGPSCGEDGFSEGLFYDPLLTPSGRSLYFIGSTTAAGHELWTSDGTTGGTVMVRDIVFGPGDGMKVGPWKAACWRRFPEGSSSRPPPPPPAWSCGGAAGRRPAPCPTTRSSPGRPAPIRVSSARSVPTSTSMRSRPGPAASCGPWTWRHS